MFSDGKIVPVNIREEMKKCYIDYAMSVIVGRGKMKACFEIKQNPKTFYYEIVQASGPGNARINRKYKFAIEEWQKRHKIKGEISFNL